MQKTISLFCNPSNDDSISFKLYAQYLSESLITHNNNKFSIKVFKPNFTIPEIFKKNYVLSAGFNNIYKLRYHAIAHKERSEVNHILEQRYAHLLYSLGENKSIVTCHDLVYCYPEYHRLPLLNKTIWYLEVSCLQKARKIIAVSENTKKDIIKFLKIDEDKISVIYHGVGKHFKPIYNCVVLNDVKKKYTLNDSHRYILHVGRNAPHKNIEVVLTSIAQLNKKLKLDVVLLKIGESFTREQLHIIKRLQIETNVVHLGVQTEENIALLLNISNALLFPSLYEGFGWPVLEAMACGTPVICSNTSSLPEIVGDAALTAAPDDCQTLTQYCYDVLTNQSLAKFLREKGIKRATEFSWDKAADAVLRLYEEM